MGVMRWDGQSVRADDGALPGLARLGLVRSVRTPEFDGITFHEILCKSALNKVPDAAMLPFRYTVNGYRGCSHACGFFPINFVCCTIAVVTREGDDVGKVVVGSLGFRCGVADPGSGEVRLE